MTASGRDKGKSDLSPSFALGSPEPVGRSQRSSGETTRLFHMVDSLRVGGSESQMAQVALRLKAANYQVTVGCLRAEGPLLQLLREAKIDVAEFPPGGTLLSLNGLYQLGRLARFIRQRRFHVVHAHDLWSDLLAVPAAWLARTPVIISSRRDLGHLAWYTPQRRKILRWIQRLSTFVVANSAAVREVLVRNDGFPPARIRVIYNGVDLERFGAARGDRQKLFPGQSPNAALVAIVANMGSEVKGHAHLIEAAETVCRMLSQTRFVLIGDGELRPRIEAQVSERGLREHFLFLGSRKDVPELLSCCDLSVLASVAEGFPNAVLESLAAGLPTVATRVGGTEEIIEDGVSGLLVPPRDPQALARAVIRILSDRPLAARLAGAGQERVRQKFSFDRLLQELEELYRSSREARGATPQISPAQREAG